MLDVINIYQIIIISIVAAIIIFKIIVRIKYGFWSIQPVFHFYNLFYWIYPIGIINKQLPKNNKYCDFINIKTEEYVDILDNDIDNIIEFIQKHYYRTKFGSYLPSKNMFSANFDSNNKKNFVTTYFQDKKEFDNDNNLFITKKYMAGVITSKNLNITLNNTTFNIYYVDYLTVDSNYRKSGLAPKIIQTHEYWQASKNNSYQISLFKREGELTGIVPLCIYKTYQFNNINIIPKLHASTNIIEINKQNIQLFTNFIHSRREFFECFILPDLSNLLSLINNNIYKIYGLICNNELISCYCFRDSYMLYNNTDKSIEFFASISNCKTDELFFSGFLLSLKKSSEYFKSTLFTCENLSDNIIISKKLLEKYTPKLTSPTAYFLYNYANYTIKSDKTFIIT